jgi:hypothetical protein
MSLSRKEAAPWDIRILLSPSAGTSMRPMGLNEKTPEQQNAQDNDYGDDDDFDQRHD